MFGRRFLPSARKIEKPLARTSSIVSPGMPCCSSASVIFMKFSTIRSMCVELQALSAVSRGSASVPLAASTSGLSQGSLKSAVVLKSNDCFRMIGALAHPLTVAASARSTGSRLIERLSPIRCSKPLAKAVIASFGVRGRITDPVDALLALDPGRRGIANFFQPGGALAAARALRGARRVMIVTGFVVEAGMPETDGPPGAAALGRALRRLGAIVRYATDAVTVPIVAAALRAVGEPQDVLAYPTGADAAARLLAETRPTHLVAIERPGRSASGDWLNMRGRSVRAWNAPMDDLFRPRAPRGHGSRRRGRPVTVGVGDGGNEIGMGNVRVCLLRQRGLGARLACTTRVDHLVVAGVSNWGAYGIVAQLARLTGRPLLHGPDDERRMIEACVAAGACDGITRRRQPTVDGLPADVHAAIVALLGVSWGP